MKPNNLKLTLGIAFILLAFAPLINASSVTSLLYFDGNPTAQSSTINQGDSFVIDAYGYSVGNENIQTAKLYLVSQSGTEVTIYNTNVGSTNYQNIDYEILGSLTDDLSGTYSLKLKLTTILGHTATATLTLIVKGVTQDTTAPVITLNGANPQQIEVFDSYTELGATAVDNIDGNIDVDINSRQVNINVLGNYQVFYTATDNAGNTITKIRSVNVVDTTAPTITLDGENPQQIELGSHYVELGGTATDNYYPSYVLDYLVDSSEVDTSSVGTYHVYYTASDGSGNTAITTRIVNVYDPLQAPVITVVTPQAITYNSKLMTFEVTLNKEVVNVKYSLDDEINITMEESESQTYSSNELTLPEGEHTVVFTAIDSESNIGIASVTFSINSNTNGFPTITILGENPISISIGSTYTDAGATAWDNEDGDLTSSIISTGTVNTNVAGIYTITYQVTDNDNHTTTAIRIVNVYNPNDLTPPTITLIKPQEGKTYDINIVFKIKTNEAGSVMYSLDGENNISMSEESYYTFVSEELELDEGTHEVIFYATDLAGNTASVTVEFKIKEDKNTESSSKTGFYEELYLEQFKTKQPTIDLTNEEPAVKQLNWFQRLINWILRLFNSTEIY